MPHARTKAARTLSIGGATYDLFMTLKDGTKAVHSLTLNPGEKHRVERVIEACGGGACNTSVGLSRLGCEASFCGVIGADQWGEMLIQSLKKENVDTRSTTVVEGEMSSFSIIVNFSGGDRSILYAPGVNEHLHDVTFDLEKLEKVDAVYLNHLTESSCAIEDDITRTLAKAGTKHLTWNPGGCQIEAGMDQKDKKELLSVTTLLLLNKEEALQFTKTKTVEEALKRCTDAGVKNVCITDGKHGVRASDGKNTWHCQVLEGVSVIDTTGAGDAFGSGTTWALLAGLGLPEALRAGTLNAAGNVSKIGAQTGLLTEPAMRSALETSPLKVRKLI